MKKPAPPPATAVAAAPAALGVPARTLGGTFHIKNRWPVLLLCSASLGLMSLSFTPIELWPLAYICLVPWAVCVCTVLRSAWLYAASYFLGVAFFAANCWWLWDVTPPGYIALCLWFAIAFPLAAWPVRHLFRRFSAPVSITLPIVWVAFEYLRGQTLVGFPWFYLAHTHYSVPRMIQIADLTGAYGVSFLIAMVNGALTDLLIQPMIVDVGGRRRRSLKLPISAALTAMAVIGVYAYGSYRLSETPLARAPGPRVAVLQQDFPYAVTADASNQIGPETAFEGYMALAEQAAVEKPDLIVLPETAWPMELNREFLGGPADDMEAIRSRLYPTATLAQVESYRERCRRVETTLQAFVDRTGVCVVIGAQATEWRGTKTPPRVERFNSSYLFTPGKQRERTRYDKVHLVLFGEFVPFRYTSLHGVYEWLNGQTPWGAGGFEYSLSFGQGYRTFSALAPSQNRTYRFATPICYEDVVSDMIRPFVRGPSGDKNVDLLFSLSNDGWFNYSGELQQHLAACVFRAVEYRVPVARAVNTGFSAFMDSSGRVLDRVKFTHEQRRDSADADAALAALQKLAERAAAAQSPSFDASQTDVIAAIRIIQNQLPPALQKMTPRSAASQPALDKTYQSRDREGAGTVPLENDVTMARSPLPHGRGSEIESASQTHSQPAPPDQPCEFDFLHTRLSGMMIKVRTSGIAQRGPAWSALARQVAADRATLARWIRKPQTAPGYRIGELPIDDRYSLYTQWGDWFAYGCVIVTGGMLLDWLVHRVRRPSRRKRRKLAKRAARQNRATA